MLIQWGIQDFPEGVPTYYLTNFPRKPHGNEEIVWPGKGGGGAFVVKNGLLTSRSVWMHSDEWQWRCHCRGHNWILYHSWQSLQYFLHLYWEIFTVLEVVAPTQVINFRCGFAGENGPRAIVPSEVKRQKTGMVSINGIQFIIQN